jgi:hypothetical protein
MSATLKLSRPYRLIMATVKFKIFLDGKLVGTIAHSETEELPLGAGTHTLQLLSILGLKSPARTFAVIDGETAEFACHTRAPFVLFTPYFIVSFIASLFRQNLWIVLKRA